MPDLTIEPSEWINSSYKDLDHAGLINGWGSERHVRKYAFRAVDEKALSSIQNQLAGNQDLPAELLRQSLIIACRVSNIELAKSIIENLSGRDEPLPEGLLHFAFMCHDANFSVQLLKAIPEEKLLTVLLMTESTNTKTSTGITFGNQSSLDYGFCLCTNEFRRQILDAIPPQILIELLKKENFSLVFKSRDKDFCKAFIGDLKKIKPDVLSGYFLASVLSSVQDCKNPGVCLEVINAATSEDISAIMYAKPSEYLHDVFASQSQETCGALLAKMDAQACANYIFAENGLGYINNHLTRHIPQMLLKVLTESKGLSVSHLERISEDESSLFCRNIKGNLKNYISKIPDEQQKQKYLNLALDPSNPLGAYFALSNRSRVALRELHKERQQNYPLTPEQELKERLGYYIARIEKSINVPEANVNFKHGFWVMKDSRAANRLANYRLAKRMVEEVARGTPLAEILAEKDNWRKDVFPQGAKDRGINSSELNQIFSDIEKKVRAQRTRSPN